MNKVKVLILLIFAIAFKTTTIIHANETIQLTLNGTISQMEEYDPYIDSNNRLMVSVRFIAEQLNYKVEWNNIKQTALISNSIDEITFRVDDNTIHTKNGVMEMDSKAEIRQERLFIPIRFIAESFNLEVRWNSNNNMVYLVDSAKILFEDYELKLGALIPNGMKKSEYKIKKEDYTGCSSIGFYSSNSEGYLFSLNYYDINYWNEVIKDNIPVRYNEIYANNDKYLIMVFPSDVQYNPESPKDKQEYERLFETAQSICDSLYIYTN